MDSSVFRQLYREYDANKRLEIIRRLPGYLSRAELEALGRYLPKEPNFRVQKELVNAFLRNAAFDTLQQAIKKGCPWEIRKLIVQAIQENGMFLNKEAASSFLFWMFRRDRSYAVRKSILEALLVLSHRETLQRLAEMLPVIRDRKLRNQMIKDLARHGFSQGWPELVGRAMAADPVTASYEVLHCARQYVRPSPLQQKILLVIANHPDIHPYCQANIKHTLREAAGFERSAALDFSCV